MESQAETCVECRGVGTIFQDVKKTCFHCQGSGRFRGSDSPSSPSPAYHSCHYCHGSGSISNHEQVRCRTCDGYGRPIPLGRHSDDSASTIPAPSRATPSPGLRARLRLAAVALPLAGGVAFAYYRWVENLPLTGASVYGLVYGALIAIVLVLLPALLRLVVAGGVLWLGYHAFQAAWPYNAPILKVLR